MKLGKLALIGVLTFSGFTAIEMSKPTSQAAAATQIHLMMIGDLKPLWIYKIQRKVHINQIGRLGI